MLVLARNNGERIVITVPPSTGETTIVVTVVNVKGNHNVRLGFEAPREIRILREEIVQKIKEENDGTKSII